MTRKRPVRVRRDIPVLRQECIVSGNFVQPVKLTNETIRSFAEISTPTQDNFVQMIKWVCQRKKWSFGFYATLCGTDTLAIRKIVEQGEMPSGPLARMIWILYAIDTNPDLLKDPVHIATWGAKRVVLPVRRTDERERIRALMVGTPGLSVRQIAETLLHAGIRIDNRTVYHVAKEVGYKFSLAPRESKKRLLSPTSVWLQVDWSRSNREISEATGMAQYTVLMNRIKLRNTPKEKLLAAFLAAGRDIVAVEALLRCHRRK